MVRRRIGRRPTSDRLRTLGSNPDRPKVDHEWAQDSTPDRSRIGFSSTRAESTPDGAPSFVPSDDPRSTPTRPGWSPERPQVDPGSSPARPQETPRRAWKADPVSRPKRTQADPRSTPERSRARVDPRSTPIDLGWTPGSTEDLLGASTLSAPSGVRARVFWRADQHMGHTLGARTRSRLGRHALGGRTRGTHIGKKQRARTHSGQALEAHVHSPSA